MDTHDPDNPPTPRQTQNYIAGQLLDAQRGCIPEGPSVHGSPQPQPDSSRSVFWQQDTRPRQPPMHTHTLKAEQGQSREKRRMPRLRVDGAAWPVRGQVHP